MEAHQVYTPKAVMLLTRIKRNLAAKGVRDHIDSWDYEEVCSLCEGYEDAELEECLVELKEEIHHSTPPNAWAM